MARIKQGAGLDKLTELDDFLMMHIHRQATGNTASRVTWEYHKYKGFDYDTFQRDITVSYYGKGLKYDSAENPVAGTVTSMVIKDAKGKVFFEMSDLSVAFKHTALGPDSNKFLEQALKGNDLITGTNGSQIMNGWGGNDDLRGYGGNDLALGGAGNDTLSGGDGNDTLFGDLKGTQNLFIKNGNDTINAGNGNDTANGGGGNDTLNGQNGNDALNGEDGRDTLNGGADKDKLTGGAGADILTGGTGADQFIFQTRLDSDPLSNGRPDMITDFKSLEGDILNFAAVDANNQKSGNQAFTFIGTEEFSGKPGEIRYEKIKGDIYVYANLNSDPEAEMVVHLDNLTRALKVQDFIL